LHSTRLPTPPGCPARSLDELTPPEPTQSATWIPLGVGGPDVTTTGVDLFGAGPHLMLISGPGRSGRTTAAATIIHGLRRANIGVIAIAPPRSPLGTLLPDDAGVRLLAGPTIKDTDLRDAADDFVDGPYAVILDDCEQITVTATEERFTERPTLLQDIATPDALGRQALVMCGDATPILEGQRRSLTRVVGEILTVGSRVLLTPTSTTIASALRFALEPDQFFSRPPGRGYLIIDGASQNLQLASVSPPCAAGDPG
jgi:S-DNA-T family DNA segregation ATPase FtsK/SpoIIIE